MAESKHSAKVQMVEGSLWKNVPKFAIPVALTGILGQLFNAADIAVVGRFTGAQGTLSMAAVGANSAIVGLILNLFMGIALGATVVIATALGRKDEETVKQAVGTSRVVLIPDGRFDSSDRRGVCRSVPRVFKCAFGSIARRCSVPSDLPCRSSRHSSLQLRGCHFPRCRRDEASTACPCDVRGFKCCVESDLRDWPAHDSRWRGVRHGHFECCQFSNASCNAVSDAAAAPDRVVRYPFSRRNTFRDSSDWCANRTSGGGLCHRQYSDSVGDQFSGNYRYCGLKRGA